MKSEEVKVKSEEFATAQEAQVSNNTNESVEVAELSMDDIKPRVVKATIMPLGSHGTLVIAGVGGTKKTAGPAVQTDLQSGCGECKDLKSDERIANANTHGGAIANHAERKSDERIANANTHGGAIANHAERKVQDSVPQGAPRNNEITKSRPNDGEPKGAMPTVTLVVYTTKRGDQAPRIEGFGGETDPRWKRHYDAKVRLAEEKKKADAFNEKLQEKMKGKKKEERDKLRKQWKSVGSDPFGASYFTDRTTGEKHYQMILGAKYMDAAQQLTDAYNSGDAAAIAAAEQSVINVKNGIVSDYKAQKAARAAEREAERKAKREAEKSVGSGSAATEPSFTLDQVAAMLGRLLPEGAASTEDIKKLLQTA